MFSLIWLGGSRLLRRGENGDGIPDCRTRVRRNLTGNLHLAGNESIGLVNEASLNVAAFDGGERGAHVLRRHYFGRELVPKPQLREIFL